jgi:hypothetical protein
MSLSDGLNYDRLRDSDKPQPKTRVEFSAVVSATARQARDSTANAVDPREVALTIWTFIQKTPQPFGRRQGEIVTALLVPNPQMLACLTPFIAVRLYSTSTGAKLGEQMSQFVAEGALNFCGSVFMQPRVQQDQFPPIIGATRATFQAGIPFHSDFTGNATSSAGQQQLARFQLQIGILTG